MESDILKIIESFRNQLDTEKGKAHIAWLREREPREVKEVLAKLKEMPKDSTEFGDLVLYGLLPNFETTFAKRVSISPSFMNI